MLKIENVVLPSAEQWEAIIRGMRNPKNSWDRMDSGKCSKLHWDVNCDCDDPEFCPVEECDAMVIGPNDHNLMSSLAAGGPVHAKYRRKIVVYLDITAPLYWWKEMDTYKIGTSTDSCSTMHKIHAKEFTLEDFSCEHLLDFDDVYYCDADQLLWREDCDTYYSPKGVLEQTIYALNVYCERFLETKDKKYWWQMIQLLPTSYNQRRSVMLNYEVLVGIYKWRKNHKLDEWHTFCDWIESLPYSELIIGDENVGEKEEP